MLMSLTFLSVGAFTQSLTCKPPPHLFLNATERSGFSRSPWQGMNPGYNSTSCFRQRHCSSCRMCQCEVLKGRKVFWGEKWALGFCNTGLIPQTTDLYGGRCDLSYALAFVPLTSAFLVPLCQETYTLVANCLETGPFVGLIRPPGLVGEEFTLRTKQAWGNEGRMQRTRSDQ